MLRGFLLVLLTVLTLACGGSDRGAASPPPSRGGGGSSDGAPAAGGGDVETKVIVQKMPDGSVRKTTITTRRVEAPAPPPRPADPFPADPLVKYNVDRINAYRAAKNLPALLYDAQISSFARTGSERLSRDHAPHAHFAANARGAPGFGSRSAENQGDPGGVPQLDPDPLTNGKKQIDIMMKMMMDEGPGGGHHDNMMNPSFRRVGIGLVYAGGKLYLTNDFSN